MTSTQKIVRPLIILFLILNIFFLLGNKFLLRFSLDSTVLLVANLLFFIISLMAFFMQKKALLNANPNVFIRSVMGGMMLKMAICMVAVAVYVLSFKNSFSKMSVFASMFLYLIYLAVEVSVATKMNKKKNG